MSISAAFFLVIFALLFLQVGATTPCPFNILQEGEATCFQGRAKSFISRINVEQDPKSLPSNNIVLSYRDNQKTSIQVKSSLKSSQFFNGNKPYHYAYSGGLEDVKSIWDHMKADSKTEKIKIEYEMCFKKLKECEEKTSLTVSPLGLLATLGANLSNKVVNVALKSKDSAEEEFVFSRQGSNRDPSLIVFEISIACWNLSTGEACTNSSNKKMKSIEKYPEVGGVRLKAIPDTNSDSDIKLGLVFMISKLHSKNYKRLIPGIFSANYNIEISIE